jgi:hypothetical protein
MEQTYPGRQDHERHFHAVLPAFEDRRYVRVRDMPVFVIYQPRELPDLAAFIDQWQTLASKNGIKGIHFVAHLSHHEWGEDYESVGFSGAVVATNLKMLAVSLSEVAAKRAQQIKQQSAYRLRMIEALRAGRRISFYVGMKAWRRLLRSSLYLFHYEDASRFFVDQLQAKANSYPCAIPSWDNSPRSGTRALILHGSTPQLFGRHLEEAIQLVENRDREDRIIFVKSWNEWAEGNYLEPDQKFGHQYLDVVRETVFTR